MTQIRLGMIGYGFMGRAHTNAFKRVPDFFPELKYKPVLQAACGRNQDKVNAFAAQWGFASTETDWRKLLERDDIDAVDICAPNDRHKEIALAAIAQGKMVLCEKPLAMNTADGIEMAEAAEKAGVANTVWYNYRRIPAVMLAKHIVESGKLGRIYHYRANFLQDWCISEDVPQGGASNWRLNIAEAGSGVTGDLLAHCIDTALWLNGSIDKVTAMTETFVKQGFMSKRGSLRLSVLTMPVLFSVVFPMALWGFLNQAAMPVAIKRYTPLKSTVPMLQSAGICMIFIASNTSIMVMKALCADGVLFM